MYLDQNEIFAKNTGWNSTTVMGKSHRILKQTFTPIWVVRIVANNFRLGHSFQTINRSRIQYQSFLIFFSQSWRINFTFYIVWKITFFCFCIEQITRITISHVRFTPAALYKRWASWINRVWKYTKIAFASICKRLWNELLFSKCISFSKCAFIFKMWKVSWVVFSFF